jgi:hypothetical protein
VELAVSLPALMLMVLTALTAVTAVRTQIQCLDAAREAARAAARGEPAAEAAGRVAPPGAATVVAHRGSTVAVTVRATVRPLGSRLPGFDITVSAVAMVEPAGSPSVPDE